MTYSSFLYGALVAMSLLAGLFFLRYWYLTRDRFFIGFACAFWTFAVNWGMLAYYTDASENIHYIYAVRLLGFMQIIAAILIKNRRSE
ncbi:MAG TPA: DUF5985 family protein [Kofleriaceae bacterium]|jgi:hypothetical protein|nr:DUF5985 family protein [Kofleriaceae bacterium]